MRALAETSVHTVERTLDWNMHVLLVDLAIGTSIFRVTHACTIVAPTGVTTVIGASFDATVLASIARFTPASSIQAQAIVGTVVHTHGD